jgi:adenosylhomocysteinase
MRAKGLGALVTVTEIDPVKAIEARMDGFEVKPMVEAAKTADIIMTVTGCKDIVTRDAFAVMKDGCVMGNVGHFDNEINKKDLEEMSVSKEKARDFVDRYVMQDGRKLYLIADGRLMNLAAGQGHPAEIMDTSFASQAMGVVYLSQHHDSMDAQVYRVPDEIDREIALIKLRSLGIAIDVQTKEQYDYTHSWQQGT